MSKKIMINLKASIVKRDYSEGYQYTRYYFDNYSLWYQHNYNQTSINPSHIVQITSEKVLMGEMVRTKKTVKGGLFRSCKTIKEDVLQTNYKQWVIEYTIEMVGGTKHTTTMDIHAAIRATA